MQDTTAENVVEDLTESPASASGSVPNGPAWAALLAAGIGAAAFGVFTDLSESIPSVSKLLVCYRPSGALSGVAICAILVWIGAWVGLHFLWKRSNFRRQWPLMTLTCLLAIAAIVATFPPFYELFGG